MLRKDGRMIMIRNIIFDIGQVLADFQWREYIKDLGYNAEISERIAKATVLSPYWNEVDRGVIPMTEIIENCVHLDQEIEAEIRHYFKDCAESVKEYDYSEELVHTLKKNGYNIYLLSNYGGENFAYVKDLFRFLPLVDGGVISYEVKHIKPEPEIYKALIDKYEINPKESVFLDDLEKNLEGAKKFGFHTILFQSLDKAKSELRELDVRI